MTRLALLHPSGLLATEMRETLDRRTDLWQELRLLSDDAEDIGGLTEIRGAAAVIGALDDASFDGIDVAIFSGGIEKTRPLLSKVPAGATAIVLSPDAGPDDGHGVIAGVNLDSAADHPVLLSPNPAAVALAHLLLPLQGLGLRQASATLLQPVSVHGRSGLDEVFEQTRGILAFASESSREIFQAQMAFNILPAGPQPHVAELVRRTTGLDVPLSIHILQAAVFHSYSISLHVQFADDPGVEAVRDALQADPFIDASPDPELLGPIDAAARDEVVLGDVMPVPGQPGTYQVWAVMDNLTCGGALNAVQILEAVRPPQPN